MADPQPADTPPELSESTKRKLKIQWDTLLEKRSLTKDHVARYDVQRRLLLETASRRATRDWVHAGQAAPVLCLSLSVGAAEEWFRRIEPEYWSRWCSSGAGYETYANQLDILMRQVVADFESIWKGWSDGTDQWFKKTCAPAIKKALTARMKRRIAQAREVDLQRPESVSSPARTGTGNPILDEILAGGDNLSPQAQEAIRLARVQMGLPKDAVIRMAAETPETPAPVVAANQAGGLPSPQPTDEGEPRPSGGNATDQMPEQAPAGGKAIHSAPTHVPTAVQVIKGAMAKRGLNPSRLAKEIRLTLRRKKSNLKADRATVYRITEGITQNPSPELTNAFIEALKLQPEQAAVLRRDFGKRARQK